MRKYYKCDDIINVMNNICLYVINMMYIINMMDIIFLIQIILIYFDDCVYNINKERTKESERIVDENKKNQNKKLY